MNDPLPIDEQREPCWACGQLTFTLPDGLCCRCWTEAVRLDSENFANCHPNERTEP